MDPLINDQAAKFLQALSGNLSLLPAIQIVSLAMLVLWRYARYGSCPRAGECAVLIGSLLALYMAGTVLVVLAFTYPPRYEYLSQLHLKSAGLFTAIITIYQVGPGLRKLIIPEAPAASPERGPSETLTKLNQNLEKEQSAKH